MYTLLYSTQPDRVDILDQMGLGFLNDRMLTRIKKSQSIRRQRSSSIDVTSVVGLAGSNSSNSNNTSGSVSFPTTDLPSARATLTPRLSPKGEVIRPVSEWYQPHHYHHFHNDEVLLLLHDHSRVVHT